MTGDEEREWLDDDRCTNCGDPVDTDEWHPVQSYKGADSVTVYTFCSESCAEEWER